MYQGESKCESRLILPLLCSKLISCAVDILLKTGELPNDGDHHFPSHCVALLLPPNMVVQKAAFGYLDESLVDGDDGAPGEVLPSLGLAVL